LTSHGAIYNKSSALLQQPLEMPLSAIAPSWLAINRHERSYLQQPEAPFSGALVPLSAVERDNIDHGHGAIYYISSTFLQQPLEMPLSAGDKCHYSTILTCH
jgi:hypothetical protein